MSFMSEPQHVLVYEFLSAGGIIAGLAAHEQAELLEQGTAMRDAMLADLADPGALPGLRLGCVVPPSGPGAALPAGVEPLAARPGETHARLLQRAAQQGRKVWAVAPETAGLLLQLARAVPAPQWLGCTPDAIQVAGSKAATRRQLAAHGVAVPDAAPGTPGPWVVKPDDGAGAAGARRHPHYDAAWADMQQRGRDGLACTMEPWVDGEALSLSLCCAAAGAQLISVNRQDVQVDGTGALHFLGVRPAVLETASERGRRLAALAASVMRALPGLRGFAGVDLVWHPERGPVVIEVNPRLTTAYVGLSAALGFNVAQRLLAAQQEAA
jgi:predicted ATP-grasp superfamily ATP-dependent carboligase